MKHTIVLTPGEHLGEKGAFASFPFSREIWEIFKSLSIARWSQNKRRWHVPASEAAIRQLGEAIGDLAFIDHSQLHKQNPVQHWLPSTTLVSLSETPDRSHELAMEVYCATIRLVNFSENTLKNYSSWFSVFLRHFPGRDPVGISTPEIMDFLIYYKDHCRWSSTIQNQLINAIKFFYERVLKQPRMNFDLPRAKKEQRLPPVFSEDEVRRIIIATENPKHRAILCTAYAGGLRVSEIVNLKLVDIDIERMVINIREAKGKKDRQIMLSPVLLDILNDYLTHEKIKPKVYVFEGRDGGKYSTRSAGEIIEHSKKKAGITKKGSIHALRHTFATQLVESGTDLFAVKDLLGHKSLRTTFTYTHVSRSRIQKIQSPLDKLKLPKPPRKAD